MAAAIHSSELQWQLLRTSHSFLVKRNGATFSSEPLNLTNKHSAKFSGLTNARAVGVTLAGKKVNLQLRAGKKATLARPAKSVQSVTLANDFRRKSSRAARTIQALTTKSFLRPDLAAFAITRYNKLRKASLGVAAKKTARRRSRKAVA